MISDLEGAELTAEQKKLANEAHKKLAEAVFLVGVGSLSAKGLVGSIQAVPDHVKSLGRFKALKYAKYVKNVPKAVKDMGYIVKNSTRLLKELKELNDTLAKVEVSRKSMPSRSRKPEQRLLKKNLKRKLAILNLHRYKKRIK